jgi:X-Pro dipeptidyl-peptidase
MRLLVALGVAALGALEPAGQAPPVAVHFVDGLAQPVFENQDVIRHDVWVEVPGLDTDRDGLNDRIRVHVARPAATEAGAVLPVILTASPYAGGTNPYPRHELNVDLFVPGGTERGRIGLAGPASPQHEEMERFAETVMPLVGRQVKITADA